MEHLIGHYKPQTIEIAERFKFFKRHQLRGESTTDFMTELRRLVKTWKLPGVSDQGSICVWIT